MKSYYNGILIVTNKKLLPLGFEGEYYIGTSKDCKSLVKWVMDKDGNVEEVIKNII